MSGLILLDEEQQRSLYTASGQLRQAPPPPPPPPRFHVEPSQYFRAGMPRTDFTTGGAGPQEPRTNFTTNAGAARTDFTSNSGLPRTDFTTHRSSGHSAGGKPSGATHRSSLTTVTATVDYTGRGGDGTVYEEPRGDSYPILRDDPTRASSTDAPSNHAVDEYAGTSSGLKISVPWIMAGLVMGLILGVVLSEVEISSVAARWISLPGDLFLRALKCLVVPYVFCSVAVAIGDIVFVGKVSVIGWQTAKIFVMFWVTSVTLGVVVALLFRPFFRLDKTQGNAVSNVMGFTCANKNLLTTTTNGTVACATNATRLSSATSFVVVDKNDLFTKKGADVATLSLSDQLYQMIIPTISKNIIASFANTELLSIITFSMLLGSIAGRSYFTKTRHTNYLYLSLLQLRNTFFLLMEWTIWLSPIAVMSIVAGSFASNRNFLGQFGDVYPYLLAAISAALLQVLVAYPLIVFLLTRTNPYTHMKKMVRAYMFAFACASSLATMPVMLSCVKSARMCSQSVANFVVSIGVVSNISGMGFYLPISLVFIAEASGNGDLITPLRVVGMFVLSLLTCTGVPPIPAAGLVVISTAYTTLFGDMPATTFGYVVAMDFFFDRIVTVCNVNDDVMALKIISETTDETVAQDHLGERF